MERNKRVTEALWTQAMNAVQRFVRLSVPADRERRLSLRCCLREQRGVSHAYVNSGINLPTQHRWKRGSLAPRRTVLLLIVTPATRNKGCVVRSVPSLSPPPPRPLPFPLGWANACISSGWFVYNLCCMDCYCHILALPNTENMHRFCFCSRVASSQCHVPV